MKKAFGLNMQVMNFRRSESKSQDAINARNELFDYRTYPSSCHVTEQTASVFATASCVQKALRHTWKLEQELIRTVRRVYAT